MARTGTKGRRVSDGKQKRKLSRAYLKEILERAATLKPSEYKRVVQGFRGKLARVWLEEGEEEFYIKGDDRQILVLLKKPRGVVNLKLAVSRTVLAGILEGKETPVEAFFLGNLRAQGTTHDLYQMHKLFINMAEIAVGSPKILALVEEFVRKG